MIESENKLIEEKFRFEVDNIKVDLNNREQIVQQIKMTEIAEEDASQKVHEMKRKVEKQQIENSELRAKLENLKRNSALQIQNNRKNTIKELKELEDQIKQVDLKIAHSPKTKDNKSYLSPTSIRNSHVLNMINGNGNKREFPYVKIIEDIEEIKTILTTNGDDKEYSLSNSMIRKGEISRLPSPKSNIFYYKF